MSLGFFHFRHCAVAMALALSGAGSAELHAADGRPIEFSPIEGQPARTNTIDIGSPLSSRMNYLERIGRPDTIDFRPNSTDYSPETSSSSVARSKRRRQSDKLEPATPEEAFNNYIAKEILKLPDSDSDSDPGWASLMERFNERLWRGRSETNASSVDELSDWRDARQGRRFKGMSDRLSASDGGPPSLKALLGDSGSAESPIRRPVTLSDVFGPAKSGDSAAEAIVARKVQQDQIDAFRKVLDFQPTAARLALSPVGVPSSAAPAPASAWSVSPRPNPFGTPPGLAAPSFVPSVPATPAGPGGLSTPLGILPATPAPVPARLTPPQSVFSVPQRQF